jgi:hypothetical protein
VGAACSYEEQVVVAVADPEVGEAASAAEYSNHSTDIHIHVGEKEKVGIERKAEEKEGRADPSGVYFVGFAEEVATCVRRAEATAMAVDVDEEANHSEIGNA